MKTKLLGILGMFVLSLTTVLADADGSCWGMGGMMSGSFGIGGMLFGLVFGLLVLVVLVLLIVWLVKQIQKK